jgi:molybdopterin-binding protein
LPSRISVVPKQFYNAGEAAKLLGISLAGRIETARDSGNRRIVSALEVQRLRGEHEGQHLSARNRIQGTVTDVRVEGLIAQVELAVDEPARLVAIVTADAVDDLGLEPGMAAAAVVKATSVMVEHS